MQGRPDLAFARWFDRFDEDGPPSSQGAERGSGPVPWPRQIEFSVSNTCNLQCVMCNGDWSSSIRSMREGRPPLPTVYDDAFFEELDHFLPHLDQVKFLGGEPFLAAETLRIMERLVSMGLTPDCHVTTNGTQWSPRVERVLEMLPVAVSVSLDAATAKTYEAIRVGSSWDRVMLNLDRFRAYAASHDRYLSLLYCLMVPNWQEFGQFCLMADEWDLPVTVNTVTQPDRLSLYKLAPRDLTAILGELEAQDRVIRDRLNRNRHVWDDELARLRSAASVPEAPVDWPATGGRKQAPLVSSVRRDHVARNAARIELSAEGRVTAVSPGGPLADLVPESLLGCMGEKLFDRLRELVEGLGEPVVIDVEGGDGVLRVPVAANRAWVVLVETDEDGGEDARRVTVSISAAEDVPA